MVFIYGVGLAMALLTGGAIGVLLTAAHYQRIASQQEEYETEIAESREFFAVFPTIRHIRPVNPMDDGVFPAGLPR